MSPLVASRASRLLIKCPPHPRKALGPRRKGSAESERSQRIGCPESVGLAIPESLPSYAPRVCVTVLALQMGTCSRMARPNVALCLLFLPVYFFPPQI